MTTLDEFTESSIDPEALPHLRKLNTVRNPHHMKEKIGSTVEILNRDDGSVRGYYSSRKTDPNLFHKYDSYPVTLKVLARLQYEDAKRVVILERDVDAGISNVYEFALGQYLDAPTFEWERVEDGEEFVDKQACAAREDALHVFRDVDKRDLFTHPDDR